MSETGTDTLTLGKEGPVAWITVNRPPLNGITPGMVVEMHGLLSDLALDSEVRVVVITGSGGPGNGFLPGADLNYMLSPDNAEEIRAVESDPRYTDAYRVPALIHEMPQVTVAGINGAVAGAGLGWALACDFRLAAESARFNTAFLTLGLAGDMGLPWSLPRLVGAAKARELCFLPGKFSAEQAKDLGLLSAMFPDAAFRDGLQAFVDRLLEFEPRALQTLKSNFVAAESLSFRDYLDLETARHLPLVRRGAAREGFARFLNTSRSS